MQRDGTKSLVVFSRGIERYVTECALDYVDSMRNDTHTVSSGKLGAERDAAKSVTVIYNR